MNGCMRWGAIGCGAMLMLGLACGIFGAYFVRQAIPEMEPLEAVTVEGECEEVVVRAFLDGQEERLDTALEDFESLGDLESDAGGMRAAIDSIDLAALEASRDRLLGMDAPACAEGLLLAEAGLVDTFIESVKLMQACEVDSSLCLTREMIGAISRISAHGERIDGARRVIAEAAGIDPEEYSGDGGLDIRVGPGSGR